MHLGKGSGHLAVHRQQGLLPGPYGRLLAGTPLRLSGHSHTASCLPTTVYGRALLARHVVAFPLCVRMCACNAEVVPSLCWCAFSAIHALCTAPGATGSYSQPQPLTGMCNGTV